MKKNKILTSVLALSMAAIMMFTGCSNSRFDRFNNGNNETGTTGATTENGTNQPTENGTEPSTEQETTGNNNGGGTNTGLTEEEKKAEQEAFDKLLTEEYVDSMKTSLISTHFDLKDPEAFGITEYDSVWENIDLDAYENDVEDTEELIEEIKNFNYDALTEDQQLTYDTLLAYLENSIPLGQYYYLSESFSPSSGVQFSLPLLLSEYSVYDEDDIKDYLIVLESVDEYVTSLLEYAKWRADQGYAPTDKAIDDVIEQCNDILSASEPAFLSVILETIDGCDFLDDTAKEDYKTQIRQLATDNFIPAYNNIVTKLAELKGTRSVDGGLCQYDGGKDYYEALVRLYTGSDKSMDELIESIEDDLYDNLMTFSLLYSKNPNLYEDMEGDLGYTYTEPDEILTNLITMLESDFPKAVCTDYDLKYVAKSMESSSNPAFYLIPQYDNYTRNIIYVNGSDEYAHMDLFPLLAHEGMPGHMYQNTYFLSLNPHPIRSLMHFSGYAEGWAQYVEHYSYDWSGIDADIASAIKANDSFGFALYSRIDIGINYEGWTLEDTTDYVAQYLADPSAAEELYELFINDPAVYLQYYIGHMEIEELRDTAMDELDNDFDIKEFHEFILTVGPTYYDIIEDRMEQWIKEQ